MRPVLHLILFLTAQAHGAYALARWCQRRSADALPIAVCNWPVGRRSCDALGTMTRALKLTASLWAHDSNTDRAVTPTFQSLPDSSFMVNGAKPAADGALLTGGAELRWRNGWSLAGLFEGEFSGTTES